MKNISLVRIDDRLIHGQVITAWVKVFPVTKILIIDNELAGNRLMSRIYRAAAPIGIEVLIKNEEDSINFIKEPPLKNEEIMILVKTPQVIERLTQNEIPISKIVLGGMGARDDRKRFNRNISVNQEEEDCLKRMLNNNISIVYQLVPLETPMDLNNIIK
ncbi:MAG: PTS sugar transporter subunit IIB [Erysipelotrichaceae bacterium]|nr:PTS sugar transporter subunit IIB [Bacillota bacterium]NLP21578.1 PTS sugar transporter subunit IIB [Erysipelotrichaceae bacterium]